MRYYLLRPRTTNKLATLQPRLENKESQRRMAVRPTARKTLADLAKKGLTQTQAARKLGVSRQYVSQLKAVLGLTFRSGWPPVPAAKVRAFAKKGLSQTEAAEQLGVSQKRVSKVAARLGIKFAPFSRRTRPARTPLGKLLRRARRSAGFSFLRLGALSGLHHRNIALIEVGGVRRPGERTMRALAKSLKGHVTYDQLVQAAPNSPWRAPARKAAPKAKAARAKTKPARKAASRKTQRTRR